MSILLFSVLFSSVTLKAENKALQGNLTLSGAWAMYPTVVAWAEAFQKIHPKVHIDISAGGAGKGAADALAGFVDIGMVSRDPDPSELQKDIKAIYVLKDAVFPIVNEKNFYISTLLKRGLSKRNFQDIYVTGTQIYWDLDYFSVVTHKPKMIHHYTRSDASGAAASWARYLGVQQEDLMGIGIYGDPGILEAVLRDPLGIGYANFSFVFNRQGTVIPGIKLIPIDANENGIADPEEIYQNRDEANRAIEKGSYPVVRRNYFFIKKDVGDVVKEFIRFTLSEEGTRIVHETAANLPLTKTERAKILESLEHE